MHKNINDYISLQYVTRYVHSHYSRERERKKIMLWYAERHLTRLNCLFVDIIAIFFLALFLFVQKNFFFFFWFSFVAVVYLIVKFYTNVKRWKIVTDKKCLKLNESTKKEKEKNYLLCNTFRRRKIKRKNNKNKWKRKNKEFR